MRRRRKRLRKAAKTKKKKAGFWIKLKRPLLSRTFLSPATDRSSAWWRMLIVDSGISVERRTSSAGPRHCRRAQDFIKILECESCRSHISHKVDPTATVIGLNCVTPPAAAIGLLIRMTLFSLAG